MDVPSRLYYHGGVTQNYVLSHEERKVLNQIRDKYYMKPVLARFGNTDCVILLDQLSRVIIESHLEVNELMEKRKEKGLINDVSQASRSIVGEMFSNCVIYLFLEAKKNGKVHPDIFITKKLSLFKDLTTIRIDGETQKPDMDLVVYSIDDNGEIRQPVVIISLKTSLRERAGQTMRWKLLMEIATSDHPLREKYTIEYDQSVMPLVCFATLDFYDEIAQPQHRGMLKFFDRTFISREKTPTIPNVSNLSSLVTYVNNNLRRD